MESSEVPFCRFNAEPAAMLFYNAVADGWAQTCALIARLAGEEWIEDAGSNDLRNAGSMILDSRPQPCACIVTNRLADNMPIVLSTSLLNQFA